MEEYAPNSHKYKESQQKKEEKRAEKVVTKEVTVKKEPLVKKIVEMLIAEDLSTVKDKVFYEVFIPYVKDSLRDSLISGIDMLFGGSGRVKSNPASTNSKTSYHSYYASKDRGSAPKRDSRERHGVDELIFEDRYEAERVLEKMLDNLEQYGNVTVADYYEFADVPSDYTDNDWGWTNLATAQTVRLSAGEYTIKLPRAIHID